MKKNIFLLLSIFSFCYAYSTTNASNSNVNNIESNSLKEYESKQSIDISNKCETEGTKNRKITKKRKKCKKNYNSVIEPIALVGLPTAAFVTWSVWPTKQKKLHPPITIEWNDGRLETLMHNATMASPQFNGSVPEDYSLEDPYPQLFAPALQSKDPSIIKALIDDTIKNDTVADRSVGALMGLVIGDAVGAPLEFLDVQTDATYLTAESDKLKYSNKNNKFDLKLGQWTDDGSMALCLADSLIVSGVRPLLSTTPSTSPGKYDGSDCRIRYFIWWHFGYNNAFVYDNPNKTRRSSVGLGGNISKSFKEIRENPNNVAAVFNSTCNDAGNGSIMRNAPVPIRFSSDINTGIEVSIEQSKGTHPGNDAGACCAFMTYITAKAIQRDSTQNDIRVFVDETIKSFLNDVAAKQSTNEGFKNLQAVLTVTPPSDKEAVWNWKTDKLAINETLNARGKKYNEYPVYPSYFGSYCMDGLAMALWALYGAKSFEDAILRCVNLCGDADTTGAICGQIAGAFFGYKEMCSSPVGSIMVSNVHTWDPFYEIPLRALMLNLLNHTIS